MAHASQPMTLHSLSFTCTHRGPRLRTPCLVVAGNLCFLSSSHRTLEGVRCLLVSQTEVSRNS